MREIEPYNNVKLIQSSLRVVSISYFTSIVHIKRDREAVLKIPTELIRFHTRYLIYRGTYLSAC